jgi:hypothetical protein
VDDLAATDVDPMVRETTTRRYQVCAQRGLLVGPEESVAVEQSAKGRPLALRSPGFTGVFMRVDIRARQMVAPGVGIASFDVYSRTREPADYSVPVKSESARRAALSLLPELMAFHSGDVSPANCPQKWTVGGTAFNERRVTGVQKWTG